eukprot:m.262485 g.262485  ORF g.262485 m.262485 type:complete len:243 (-) comp16004_c0_seq12:1229-1957(-)
MHSSFGVSSIPLLSSKPEQSMRQTEHSEYGAKNNKRCAVGQDPSGQQHTTGQTQFSPSRPDKDSDRQCGPARANSFECALQWPSFVRSFLTALITAGGVVLRRDARQSRRIGNRHTGCGCSASMHPLAQVPDLDRERTAQVTCSRSGACAKRARAGGQTLADLSVPTAHGYHQRGGPGAFLEPAGRTWQIPNLHTPPTLFADLEMDSTPNLGSGGSGNCFCFPLIPKLLTVSRLDVSCSVVT